MARRSILAALRSSRDRLSVNWECSTEMDPSEIADYASDSLITVGAGGVIQFSVVQLSPACWRQCRRHVDDVSGTSCGNRVWLGAYPVGGAGCWRRASLV